MIGTALRHYRIEEQLGRGGMGVVYRALDTKLDRPVAVKVLPESAVGDPERRARFLREARAACAVTHPAIAQVYDVDEVDGRVFLVMEFVRGRTVRDLVQRRELDLLGAVEIGVQVAQGLARAHEAGILHRDIKADNIMVTPDGHAKILDFGLAKLLTPPLTVPGGEGMSRVETKTRLGVVMGTIGYMSPEQARGRPLDHRSDLFSLGVVLYEMVTGEPPFIGDSPLDTLHALAFEETRPVTSIRAQLPPSIERVIARCLRKNRDERYPSAGELAADLKRVQREIESGISRPVPLRDRVDAALRALRERTAGEWLLPGVLVLLGVIVVVLAVRGENALPGALLTAFFGLLIYRRIRNRGRRLVGRFAAKVRKMPEVRGIVADGPHVTVWVDRALARSYVRIHALMDTVNRKMFFGEPFTVSVRDDLTDDEVKRLLRGPGVVYVRPDVLGGAGAG